LYKKKNEEVQKKIKYIQEKLVLSNLLKLDESYFECIKPK